MRNLNIKYTFSSLFLLTTFVGFAQKKDDKIGTEVVNIVKPYSPTISDAFKVKETPKVEDEETAQKEPIKYSIFSFPVASTFTPTKGVAANVDKEAKQHIFQNYVRFGGGNYGTLDGELSLTYDLSKTNYVAALVNHRSSTGGIKDVVLDDAYSKSGVQLLYGSKQRELDWNIGLAYDRKMFNWYGLPTEFITPENSQTIEDMDVKNVYNQFRVTGNLKAMEGAFDKATVSFSHFSDKLKSSENNFYLKPTISFEAAGFKFKNDFIIDYLGGSFENNYAGTQGIEYSYFNLAIQPSILFQEDAYSIQAGLGIMYSNGKNDEESNNSFNIYPQVKASYNLVDGLLVAYAGAEGYLKQNTYANLVSENPFVSPTLFIKPTSQLYDLYVGIQGKISHAVSFNAKANYKKENDYAFFVNNLLNLSQDTSLSNNQGYGYGNSFQVIYDDLASIGLFGELRYDISKTASVGVNAQINSYTTDLDEAYLLPTFKVGADVSFDITKKWSAAANLFFVGERQGLEMYAQNDEFGSLLIENRKVTLDSYFDLNAKVQYKHNERWAGFLKLNNIASQNYAQFTNVPVQGFQVLVGASYNFDF